MSTLEHTSRWLNGLGDARGTALVGVDLGGNTRYWSRGAEALFGWSEEQVQGRLPLIIPPRLFQEWYLRLQRTLQRAEESDESDSASETQRVTRDGRVVTVLHSASVVRDDAARPIGVLEVLIDVTTLEQLDMESRALAQVRERELVAMDLHDGLIQTLYSLVLSLASHERAVQLDWAAATNALKAAREDVQNVIEEMRAYVANLGTRDFLPRRLESGLRLLADGLRLNSGVDVQLDLDGAVEALLQPEVRGHVLYLTREAVSNVLRHAEASRVRIGLRRSTEAIVLKVVDNGRGFPTDVPPAANHGLRNMAERARLVGGRLHVESRPGRGTRVRLSLPVQSPRGASGVTPAL